MIKESCNLIGQETQLTKLNQKWYSHMLPFFDDCLHEKIRDQVIPYRDINDQRILQSDWMRDSTVHTQPKVQLTDYAFSR